MADDRTKITQLPLSENLDDDDLLLVVEDGVSKKAEVGYLKEVFDGGSDVSITPSLGSGTKVADYEIDGVAGAIYVPTAPTALSQLSDDSTHRLVTDTEKSTWSGKQNALTFDDVPTASSNNPVKSGGIYSAIVSETTARQSADNIIADNFDKLTRDLNKITDTSENLYNPNDPDAFRGRIGGSGNPVYDNSLITTGFIDASVGDTFYGTRFNAVAGARGSMDYKYAYTFDENKNRLGLYSLTNSEYTVADNSTKYIRFTFLYGFIDEMISLNEDASYMPYGIVTLDKDIKDDVITESNKYIKNRVLGAVGASVNVIEDVYSDITCVDGKIVGFASGADDFSNWAKMDILTFANGYKKPYTNKLTLYHKFGHCNTVDYSPLNDCLILGNGSGDYELAGKIYIIPQFSDIVNSGSQGDTYDLASVNAIVIDCASYSLGAKFNVLWGETNGDKANIAYLITAKYGASVSDSDAGDNGTVRRLLLGMGSNELTYGTIIPGISNDEFNGTFDILDTFTQDGTNYNTCNQGSCYYHNSIICGVGHSGLILWKMHLDSRNNEIWREEMQQYLYNLDGSRVSSQGTSGVCVVDDYLVVGQANGGTQIFKLDSIS